MVQRTCHEEGCTRTGRKVRKRIDGSYILGKFCNKHHQMMYNINGWSYKQYRKDYCENTDGRLGFVCTSTIIDPEWQLDADHINGIPSDDRPDNIQTLCKCCHSIKTRDNQDYLTEGRKVLGVK